MGRARSKRRKDWLRYRAWLKRRRMISLAVRESLWDRERAELVSLRGYPAVNIARGEVLFDKRGYVSPSIEKKLTAKGKRWLETYRKIQKL